MKQLDYETSNYKHKEDIKNLVNGITELTDKYLKSFENSGAELVKIETGIEKKTNAIAKIEDSLLDLSKKTDELKALKDLSNEEIRVLESKKGEINYTDNEVKKMELEDINAQIAAKKSKISKIDIKMDSTKAKVKSNNDEKKTNEKELKELEKQKKYEEEALYRTEALLELIKQTKDSLSTKVLEIINAPYRKEIINEPVLEERHNEPTQPVMEIHDAVSEIIDEPVLDFQREENIAKDIVQDSAMKIEETPKEPIMPVTFETEDSLIEDNYKKETTNKANTNLLEDIFKQEDVDFFAFSDVAQSKMIDNQELVIKNIDILKKHGIPLEYTLDQSEILYNISAQDLDDLLSIITTDDEGNGMGFSIDFTYNILNELSDINVDQLIDVYNNEFMNVNAKSGIIHLLKLTNPSLKEFSKNKKANIETLNSFGINTVDEIVKKYPDFLNMDAPLFTSVLNVFDRSDLIEKLNSDIDVVPKIIDYWQNN